ncbi:phage tail protein [Streptomyces humi]|uniref:phage tail protein n=1 Tax=Streptomyces humi TaxID=1428620 RepID=UPI0006288C78|nr:phage tail protein [Streptomyces humi]
MRIDTFTASADLVGRRIRVRWAFVPDPGETVLDAPPVTVRRKTRDFAFPDTGAPWLLYDSTAFPPAPVPGTLTVTDLPDRDTASGAQRVRERTVSVAETAAGVSREVLRLVTRTVFGADRAVLRLELDLLDVGGPGGGEPAAGTPYYYQLDSPALGRPMRAVATPGDVHGAHRTLYELIPEVYRRHDTVTRVPDAGTGLLPEAGTGGGQLRRLMDVWGAAVDTIRSSADNLRGLRAVSDVDSRFLPLLSQWVGWDLTADTDLARQRNEIRTAPRLYDAVGTVPGLRSLVDFYTGWSTRVAEFTQHVARTGAAPQRNVFAAALRDGAWWGADEASAVLGFTAPHDVATGTATTRAVLTGAATEPFALRAGMTVTIAPDGGLPITITLGPADFADPGAATAAEVAAIVNRDIGEVRAEQAAGAVRLMSRLTGEASRIEVRTAPAGLVSLDGAPRGRLATVTDAAGRLWLAHAATVGAGDVVPRLHLKACFRGAWADTRVVEPQPVAPQADPAPVALPDGRLGLAWVEHPDTGAARLRWRLGTPAAPTPARLRGDAVAPFALTAGTVLTLTGHGATERFTVRAADYADLSAARAEEVAAAFDAQLTGVTATVAGDGSLALATTATGPGTALRADLSESTAARALGFGDRALTGRGDWRSDIDWAAATDLPAVPAGRHADCTAVLDPAGAVRLCWASRYDGWRLHRLRWDDRIRIATDAGVRVLSGDGALATVTGLPTTDVREVAVDADGASWFATAAGGAVHRPDGTTAVFTPGSTAGSLATADVRTVAVDPSGAVWFGHGAGAAALLPDGTWRVVTATAGGLASADVRHIAADLAGAVWFATGAGLSRLDRTGTWTSFLAGTEVRHAAPAQDGSLWAALAHGVVRVGADGTARTLDLGAATDVRQVAPAPAAPGPQPRADDAGPVWAATTAGAVEIRSPRDIRVHTPAEGLPSGDCRAVLVDRNTVWAGTTAGLAFLDGSGIWRTVPGLTSAVRALTGSWSAPLRFPEGGPGERDPHLTADGDRLWLSSAVRQAHADPDDRWGIVVRHLDFPATAWSAPVAVTGTTATDREPALVPLGAGAARVYFRSNRGGGPRLWSADLDAGGSPAAPVTVTAGPSSDTDPAPVTFPDGPTGLLFRSDRNVGLGRLGGGVPGPAQDGAGRRAPEEASVRRFAGTVTATLADLDRNRSTRQFGDLLDYTPQRPDGAPLAADELYTPSTIGLYVERGPTGRPLVQRDADRLRQLLERFLPVNLRAVVVLGSGPLEELLFPAAHELADAFSDDYPLAEVLRIAEETAVGLPGWQVFLSTDGTSITVDPTKPTTLRRRSWWPPFR